MSWKILTLINTNMRASTVTYGRSADLVTLAVSEV